MQGLILYGPPAAGKDTVATELHRLDDKYQTFMRLKSGAGRTHGYRMTSEAKIEQLRRNNDVIWENRRYGAVYVVDRPSLIRSLTKGIPIIHLGQPEAVEKVQHSAPADWLVVSLWCSREVASARIVNRGSNDLEARLQAWDETDPLPSANLTIDTSKVSAEWSARLIDATVHQAKFWL